jgi:hypothetical protein
MHHTKVFVAACLAGLSACTPLSFALAPGAEQVQVTNVAADVSNCTPVGNVEVPKDADGFVAVGYASGQLKNQTVGLGGNVAFVTDGTLSIPQAGIAYRCPSQAGAGT